MLKKYFRSKLDCNAGEDALCVMLTPSDMQYVDAPMSASMRVICEVTFTITTYYYAVAKLKFEILDSHIFFNRSPFELEPLETLDFTMRSLI